MSGALLTVHSARPEIITIPGIGHILAAGPTVPADGTAGFAPGCKFHKTNASDESVYWYVNIGTRTSCDFDAIDLNVVEMALLSGLTVNAATLNLLSGLAATGTEINRSSQVSSRIVSCTTSTLVVTVAAHDGKIIELDRAAGIAVTLPSLAAASGAVFKFRVKTTFVGAASIKSVAGSDIMVGHARMGNDSNNGTVDWQAIASNTYDTIDLFGTANSTGGIEGQTITIEGGTGRWYVEIAGDAAGTENTPFADTVA